MQNDLTGASFSSLGASSFLGSSLAFLLILFFGAGNGSTIPDTSVASDPNM
jgi:hypothetical protein